MTAENKLETRFNPEGYQVEENGLVYMLTDLSRDDLLQVACSQMDVMESIDLEIEGLTGLVEKWRKGKVFPKTESEES